VSFGGVVALRYAARRPDRVAALIAASTPGPGWHLKPSHRRYVRFPLVSTPLFIAGMPGRLHAEIAAAIPEPAERLKFVGGLLALLVRAPLSPRRMAARARLIDGIDNAEECRRISVPTLLIAGEPTLDHVVPAAATCGYASLIAGSCSTTLDRTGHLGCLTRPQAFAETIGRFLTNSGVTPCSGAHAA
jgi:pimeloyl-ACP methyl ester carboxylesterase